MFASISWSQYFTILLVATIIYYLFIWVVFFKARLPLVMNLSNIRPSLHPEDCPDEVISTAQHVIDELRPSFRRDTSQHEILYALQQKLKKYNNWEEAGFRETINCYILGELETTCSIRLGEDDLRALWK